MTEPNPLPLSPGETVLWEGAPLPGLHQRGKVIFLMIFGTPFLMIGIALFFHALLQLPRAETASDAGLALLLTFFSLPFAGFGAFLVFGPIIEAHSAPHNVCYTLTTRAAYVRRTGRFPSLKAYPITPSTALELEPGRRAGTVWLHARLERDSDGALETTKAGFENIAEAEKVFQMIRDLQGKAE